MKTTRFIIPLLTLALAVLPLRADDSAGEPANADAGANAAADVSQPEAAPDADQPATDPGAEGGHAAPEPAPEPAAVQQLRIIEALPIVPAGADPAAPAGRMDVKAALNNRMNDLLAEPAPAAEAAAVRNQLVDLTDNASQLAILSEPGPQQFAALNVQMQALYAQISEGRDPLEVDRLLSRLRSAARRVKAIDLPEARPVGDFWLMTAELYDLNRTPLSVGARREQAAALMAEYLEDYPEAGPTESVRAAYIELQKARGIDVAPQVDPQEQEEADPAIEQPAPAE